MKKINAAIAGCGNIANIRYIYAIKQLKDKYDLLAVFDNQKHKIDRAAAELGIPGFTDYQQMLEIPGLDTVIITSYHPSHAELAIQAMKAGKNVIIEKPFATSGKDARRIVKTAGETNTFCMPLPYELYPNFIRAKKMLDEGTIGKITSCDGIFAHKGPLHAPWFFSKTEAQWGVLADLGIYPLGILAYLVGPFKSVSGKVETLIPERISLEGNPIHGEVDDNVAAFLEWENGVLGTVRTNWCTAADKNGSIYSTIIYGTEGIVYLNMLSQELIVYSPNKAIPGARKIDYLGFKESYLIDVPAYDDHLDILLTYYNSHDAKIVKEDPDMMKRQINIIETIEKLYESSEKGQRILI
jgi:predicted dehydrogenase